MGRMLRNAAMLLLLMTVITGIAYPLLVTGDSAPITSGLQDLGGGWCAA